MLRFVTNLEGEWPSLFGWCSWCCLLLESESSIHINMNYCSEEKEWRFEVLSSSKTLYPFIYAWAWVEGSLNLQVIAHAAKHKPLVASDWLQGPTPVPRTHLDPADHS